MLALRLATILIVFLCILPVQPLPSRTSSSNRPGFTVEETLPEFPPGATVIFSDSETSPKERVPINGIFLKRIEPNADQTVWIVSSEEMSGAAENSASRELAIGFVVPQLPRGSYEAWYESKSDGTKLSSIKLAIVPRLLAEDGIVRSDPGKEVEVRARIPIPKVAKKDGAAEELNLLARLTSRHPEVAQVITEAPQKIQDDGSVVWKVRIVSSGIAEVEASADGFEPAIMNVVGMPGPGASFHDAQLALLQKQAETMRQAAATAETRSKKLETEIERKVEVASNRGGRGGGGGGRARAETDRLVAGRISAMADVEKFKRQSSEAIAVMDQISAQQPEWIDETQLKPGDVLLVLGSSPIISDLIRHFDGEQLGVTAQYSHASIYVGEINGKKMVAEMWSSGYWITPLSLSTKGSRLVDVYRRYGIDDNKRNEIASRGQTIFGNPQNFVREKSPSFFSWGSGLPYAHEEIKVLALAALKSPALLVQAYVSGRVDRSAGGRRKMICSELVAWVYQDVGLPLNVQYWRALNDAGIFISDDRRRDYTTPNMIARSGDLTRVGRYLGP